MTKTTKNNASAPVGLTVHVSERALEAMATAGVVLDLRHEDEMSPERHQPITVQQGQPMETPQAWITEGTITTDLQGSMIFQGQVTGQETDDQRRYRQIGEDLLTIAQIYARCRDLPKMRPWQRDQIASAVCAMQEILEDQEAGLRADLILAGKIAR